MFALFGLYRITSSSGKTGAPTSEGGGGVAVENGCAPSGGEVF